MGCALPVVSTYSVDYGTIGTAPPALGNAFSEVRAAGGLKLSHQTIEIFFLYFFLGRNEIPSGTPLVPMVPQCPPWDAMPHSHNERFQMPYHDYNGEPVTNPLFAELLEPLLGQVRRQPKLQSRLGQMPVDDQLSAIARRDARIAELNLPAAVQTVVEAVIEIVTLKGKYRAMEWLRGQLRLSPLPATVITERAKEAGITKTALRRGRNALGVKPFKSQNRWFLELPNAT